MKEIKEIQNNFIDGIYDNDNKIFNSIKSSKISKNKLLEIYQNNLYCNLINALRLTYDYLYDYLGEKKFKEFALDFISKNRSKSTNLDDFGLNFAEFLKEKSEFYHDLAKISYFKQIVYLGENEKDFDIESLQKLTPEKLFDVKFKMSKNCFLFTSKFSLFAKKNPEISRKKDCHYLVFRNYFEVEVLKITKKEFDFLNGAKQNLTLFEIYEKYDCDIEKYLQKYVGNGVLKDFYIN